MKKFALPTFFALLLAFSANAQGGPKKTKPAVKDDFSNFQYSTESFGDSRVLRYNVPGFNDLSLKEKQLVYYLYEAALSGRDMIWDQGCKYNLPVRKTLEAILNTYKGTKSGEEWDKFLAYAKSIFFNNGLHHHYSSNKILPTGSQTYFAELIKKSKSTSLPLLKGETVDAFIARMTPIIFDPSIAPKKVNLDPKNDLVTSSATNFYKDVTQKEAESYYKELIEKAGKNAPMIGLNSQLTKVDGKVVERTWKVGGMYTECISKVVYWLQKASQVAENKQQKKTLDALIKYYKSGSVKDFDTYCIEWVKDTASRVDVVNGFIEVYGDPLGYKGSYESVVSIKDMEASKRIHAIGSQAQWFEDHSSIMDSHKKKNVKGISAKVITVVVESGDAAPSTPIGINLPNNEWIRQEHGSKSVNLGNIVRAYNESNKNGGLNEEFYATTEMVDRAKKWGAVAADLHTDMHEVIGHASGQINEGVADPASTLKNYASTLEEGRADLVALYFLPDPKLKEIGVAPDNVEIGKAAYDNYINNGLLIQLSRIAANENRLEEAHMRNRHLVAQWAFEKGKADKVIEQITKDGKTYFIINDYNKLRDLFGQLLREIQRIKSEGDYEAGKALVEGYGVNFDPALHKEVLERYSKLKLSPYKGFIQPKLVPVITDGKITDVKLEYPTDFLEQVLSYGKKYGFLPVNK